MRFRCVETERDPASVRLPSRPSHKEDDDPPQHPERLSLRWAIILLASLTAGIALGFASGPPAGVVTAATVAGLLHKILK
ncbi:hypothetical protein GCM10010486_55990 [Nonomuraea roseoviolacea subsp. carminata]